MKFENRVQRYQHLFTKTDKRIVNYIRQNGYSDAFSTINSLAHAIGTSPATMTRFSHKLDYENFQDLKFNIQQEMTETVIENSPIIQRIHKYHQQIIQQTGEFIDNDIIQTFIDKLQSSRHILFAGLGSSGLSATEFYYRMIRMGLKGNVTTDSHLMKISASLLSQSDMFIAMSNSGAYVVAITNFEGSKLTDCADLVLLTTDQSRNTDHQFINTQIATLFLIDIVSYHLLENTNLSQTYQHTKSIILDNK